MDNTGSVCKSCGKGKMFEGCIEDDWHGTLTCTECKFKCDRYTKTGNVVDMFSAKEKLIAEVKQATATTEIARYEEVILKSIQDFHTYSVQEKQALYTANSMFAIDLLKIIHKTGVFDKEHSND